MQSKGHLTKQSLWLISISDSFWYLQNYDITHLKHYYTARPLHGSSGGGGDYARIAKHYNYVRSSQAFVDQKC